GEPTPDQRPRRVGGCSQGPRSWRESAGPHVVGERCGCQWLRHFGTGHERAGTMSTDELSGVGELVHGFAQRHPGDLEPRGEFAFGGQWIAGVHVVDQLREKFTNLWHPQPNLRLLVYTIGTAAGALMSTPVEPVTYRSPAERLRRMYGHRPPQPDTRVPWRSRSSHRCRQGTQSPTGDNRLLRPLQGRVGALLLLTAALTTLLTTLGLLALTVDVVVGLLTGLVDLVAVLATGLLVGVRGGLVDRFTGLFLVLADHALELVHHAHVRTPFGTTALGDVPTRAVVTDHRPYCAPMLEYPETTVAKHTPASSIVATRRL